MRLAVGFGHCRSRLVATLSGALVGALMYLGYYHLHFVAEVVRRGIARVDLLPKFINWRMRNDFRVGRNDKLLPPRPPSNWIRFGIDLALAVTIVAGLARSRVGRVYCESCGRWTRKHMFVAAPGIGQILAEALKHGDIEKLRTIEPYPVGFLQPSTPIDLEYCPGMGNSQSHCFAYITVSEFTFSFGKAQLQKFLKQQTLGAIQLLALADKIPRLRSIAVLGVATKRSDQPKRLSITPGEATAMITPVEDSSVNVAFSAKLSVIQFFLSLTPIFLVLVGGGLLYASWAQWPRAAPLGTGDLLYSALLLSLGVLSLAVGGTICCVNLEYLNYRYTHRLTRRLIRARPDPIVDPDDPESVFVAVVPRKNWTKLNLDDPSDRGFLLIDMRGQQLLFEGLRERYRIPAKALISCGIEPIDVGNHLFATVVRARVSGTGIDLEGRQLAWAGWEAPFRPRPTSFKRPRLLGPHSAESLRQRICQLLPEVEPVAPDPVGD